ncbi:VgrG-related protein [Paenibacillus tundrae]
MTGSGTATGAAIIGSLAAKYESSGNPGTVARTKGDLGGASYGKYQFTTNSGSAKSFVNSLKSVDPSAYKTLSANPVGSAAFDNAWKQVAATNKNFEKYQHDFAKKTYYDTAAASVLKNTGLDVNKRSSAVQAAIWSTSVQHGSGSVQRIIKAAGITPNMTDEQILRRIYAERGANNGAKYFKSSPKNIQISVANRFKKELQDALNML